MTAFPAPWTGVAGTTPAAGVDGARSGAGDPEPTLPEAV
jgi:hypothetical protein